MKLLTRVLLCGFLLASVGTTWALQKPVPKRSTYVDEARGFRLEAPRFPGVNPSTPGVPLILSGATSNGFAPNVNVSVQAITASPAAYKQDAENQMKQLGMKLNALKELKVSGREAIEMDYEGALPNQKKLRFLSLSVIEKDRVVQITYTALPEDFPALLPEFRASLDSFKLK